MSSVHLACLTESVGSRQRYLMASDPKPPVQSLTKIHSKNNLISFFSRGKNNLISHLEISLLFIANLPVQTLDFVHAKKKNF